MSWRREWLLFMLLVGPGLGLGLGLLPGTVLGAPPVPVDLEAQIGDGAVSLAWRDGAGAPRSVSYLIEVVPAEPKAQVSVVGTRARSSTPLNAAMSVRDEPS